MNKMRNQSKILSDVRPISSPSQREFYPLDEDECATIFMKKKVGRKLGFFHCALMTHADSAWVEFGSTQKWSKKSFGGIIVQNSSCQSLSYFQQLFKIKFLTDFQFFVYLIWISGTYTV